MKFLFKRIISIPLTLLIVSLICFFCIKSIPYNPVDFIINLERGESSFNDERSYDEKLYSELSKKMGLDKDLFYFSIGPSHSNLKSYYEYPQTIRNKVDLLEKKGYSIAKTSLLNSSLEELNQLPSNKRFSTPRFKWNGIDNQYHDWLGKLVTGDFGVSYLDNRAVSSKIFEALKWTLFLVITALFLSFITGITWGVINYVYPKSKFVALINQFGYFIYIMPVFWIATVSMVFFTTDDYGTWTNWFSSSSVYINTQESFLQNLSRHFEIVILPVIVLSIGSLIYISRQMESALEQERHKVYADVAFVKGLSFNKVVFKHQFKNALLPIITLFTSALPASIAGSLIIETIFNIPGMGRLLYNSIDLADWNVVYAIIMLTALITSLSYILADILYYKANPRINLTKHV